MGSSKINQFSEHPKSVLICGESGAGKTSSLMNLQNHKGVLYLNCDGGKPLPFKNNFKRITVDDPYDIFDYFDQIKKDDQKRIHTVVIDTVSFLMDIYENKHVIDAPNTMKAWSEYAQFFKTLMYQYVAHSPAYVIFLGHLDVYIDEDTGEKRSIVPVKGSLKKNGIEAYFTTVLSCKKVKLSEFKKYNQTNLLTITPEEEEQGFKHVFQTKTTKNSVGDRIKSPMGLFSTDETFINNDVQLVLKRLNDFYSN